MKKAVAGLDELLNRLLEPSRRIDARRRLDPVGRRDVLQTVPQLGVEAPARTFERDVFRSHRRLARVERRAHGPNRERKPLDDKSLETTGEIGGGVDGGGPFHGRRILAFSLFAVGARGSGFGGSRNSQSEEL